MKRREFLWLSGATAVSASRLFPQVSAASVTLQIGGLTGITMPENFTGVSYESAQLAHPEFFSPQNAGLAAMFTRLNKRGVLRLGGNTSEFTKWSQTDVSGDTTLPAAVNPDTGQREKPISVITPSAIRNLRGYLDATGWDCIYGLNLGHGTPEQAAQEAKFVAATLGPKLIALQIGNEPNLYGKHLRPAGYSFADYIAEWKTFAAAVRKAVPGAKFAGPDVAGQSDWIVEFAKQHSPDTVMLTGHYYAEGPPTDPRMNIDYLLHPTQQLMHDIPVVMQAAREAKLPYRMAEGNSCYWGGKPGVSDTFASALWSGDYMLQVAQAGYSGVNLHGGGNGVYTPIAGDAVTGFTARPVFYGMQLATEFEGATFLETKLEDGGRNITAYAARKGDRLLVAIFNKSDADVEVRMLKHETSRITSYKELKAPSLESKENVSFAEASVPVHPYVAADRAVLLQIARD
jgi:hypothetical protein